jgi:hypothetical protein
MVRVGAIGSQAIGILGLSFEAYLRSIQSSFGSMTLERARSLFADSALGSTMSIDVKRWAKRRTSG